MTWDKERFPEPQELPESLKEILDFVNGDNWWCTDFYNEKLKRYDHTPHKIPEGENWEDTAEQYVTDPIKEIICRHYGHNMVPDQCNRKEHDYCERCGQGREKIENENKK